MRTINLLFLAIFFMTCSLFSGVIHESKTTVKFKGFGEFITHESVWLQNLQQHKESQNEFKAQGMMGQMIAKLLFGEKQKGEIIDLNAMKIYDLFHEKKQYRVRPIEKFEFEEGASEETEQMAPENTESQPEKSNIKIIRRVFKVVPTGKSRTINNFSAKEYHIFWVTEWVNTETGEKGKDSLFTDVWTTKSDKKLENALQEEQAFQKAFLKKVGIEADLEANSILGLNWLRKFQAMNKNGQNVEPLWDSKYTQEIKKIEGFPILVDGQYFAIRPDKQKNQKKPDSGFDITNANKMFGNLFGKALKKQIKKKGSKKEPDFSYHTELIQLKTASLDNSHFEIPAGYSQVE